MVVLFGFLFATGLGLPAGAREADKLANLVREGSIEQLSAYLATPGTDINARPDVNKALLDYAAEQNQVVVATWLLDHGARVDGGLQEGPLSGLTALHHAASSGSFEVAQLLIAHGANVNASPTRGDTPLLHAASSGHGRIVELLLQNGAGQEVRTTIDGETPLSEAAQRGYLDIVKLLMAHGATLGDELALSDAAANQHIDVVRYLLSCEPIQSAKDGALRDAIIAADSRHDALSLDIVSTLIAAGADANNTSKSDLRTPLMLARRVELRELLIAHGSLDRAELQARQRARQASQAELRDILMTLGGAREFGPSLDIAATRELHKIAPTDATWDETRAGWQRLKSLIALDLLYDVGPTLFERVDEIESSWKVALEADPGAQTSALMEFFKSDLGHRYLAFQSRLGSIQEAGMVAVATDAAAHGRSSALLPGALLDPRRRILSLGWSAGTNRCCDDVLLWMATQGKAAVKPEEIAAVAGPELDALRADFLSDLDAFATFQQSAASTDIVALGRHILDGTAAGPTGSIETIATAIQRSEQAHQVEWRQAYQGIRTAARALVQGSMVTSPRPAAAELPRCVADPQGGTSPAVVAGFPGQWLYVSPKHPRECSDIGIDACPNGAHLLSGDAVETLGTCDEWTRVRYSGARGSMIGWVTSRRLDSRATYDPVPFDLGPAEPGQPGKAHEPAVCEAAMKGAVEDAGLRDVTRYSFAPEVMRSLAGSESYPTGVPEVIAEGNIDLFNEGLPKPVVLLSVDISGRVEYHTEWPVVLDATGLPDATIAMHRRLYESAGSADHVRLFRFHGVTYMEHEPIDESVESSHEIWRFSKSEAVKVCDFTPTQSLRYKVSDVSPAS